MFPRESFFLLGSGAAPSHIYSRIVAAPMHAFCIHRSKSPALRGTEPDIYAHRLSSTSMRHFTCPLVVQHPQPFSQRLIAGSSKLRQLGKL